MLSASSRVEVKMSGNAHKEKKRLEKLKQKQKARSEKQHKAHKSNSTLVNAKERKLGMLQLILIASLMLLSTVFIFYKMNS